MGREDKASIELLRAWNSYASKSLPYLSQLVYDRNMVVFHAELGPHYPEGSTPERLVRRNLSEVLPPTTWSRVNPDLQAALTGESRSFEIPEADGNPRLLVDTTPLIEQGRIVGGVFSTQDAAMRDTSDKDLHDLTASFETVFTAAPTGMAMIGIDGPLIRVNQAFCQLTGYSEAELSRMKFQDLIHPEDSEEDLKLASGSTAVNSTVTRKRRV